MREGFGAIKQMAHLGFLPPRYPDTVADVCLVGQLHHIAAHRLKLGRDVVGVVERVVQGRDVGVVLLSGGGWGV